jgi:hypothetical protein
MIPSDRYGFSAVLGMYLNRNIITIKAFHINFILIGLDGQRVIIFGGYNITLEDSLHELNVINFEWRTPKVSGRIPDEQAFYGANVIGKYMVIPFGKYFFNYYLN